MTRTVDALHLADLCSLAYLAFSAGVVLLYQGPWLPRAPLYLLAAIAIPLLARRAADPAVGRSWRIVAALYPCLLVAAAWGELRVLIPLPWEGNYWATDAVVRADVWLFGGHPTVGVQAWHRPWLDEVMAAIYVSYYVFLLVPLLLILRGRDRAARAAAALVSLTYTVNFAFFVLVPVKSPPQILGEYPGLVASGFTGWAVADALRALQGSESVLGAAFPSSHVAGSVVCALAAWRWMRPLGRVLVPLSGGVALATVYLGYHHALDPLTGVLWGGAAYAVGIALMERRGELPFAPEAVAGFYSDE